ncbi:hypothetical protein E3P96_03728 [Wallemia ichthyophaga]|uniref:pyridoxal 5'-phosphate synthase n=1 Tax=Wallemia ichthyophaga TaxID=245174 RepID=A0A4T0G4C6_WALIC|nr:hypothetical protein E3P96_03728 [Wallemia ichthyophaga]TIB33825.1 hypothetical protein E3P86_02936 [Wallemia ichthyophaga]
MTSRININTHNQYKSPGVVRGMLSGDALVQLREWFDHAVQNGVEEPEAVNVSTVDKAGIPNARIVLSKSISRLGVSFYTNYRSAKGNELASVPYCAMTYHWRYPHTDAHTHTQRQVRLRGRVVQAPVHESHAYFNGRSEESRLGAYASRQSSVLPPLNHADDGKQTLLQQLKAEKDKSSPLSHSSPDFWGGYILVPFHVEFWSGQPSRLHDRFLYSRDPQEVEKALPADAATPIESVDKVADAVEKVPWTIDRLSP